MTPKIKVKTNFLFGGSNTEGMPLPSDISTIGDLLQHIGEEIDFRLIDVDSRHVRENIEVTINGKDIWFYPAGLDTPLTDGDLVDVSLIPLGGG